MLLQHIQHLPAVLGLRHYFEILLQAPAAYTDRRERSDGRQPLRFGSFDPVDVPTPCGGPLVAVLLSDIQFR
jgi:hypothetical protein